MNLAPGLYKFTTTALITGADVTLTGGPNDVWIFQCSQDLQLASGVKVILAGGAQANNVFWQVGTSAVLGTFSVPRHHHREPSHYHEYQQHAGGPAPGLQCRRDL